MIAVSPPDPEPLSFMLDRYKYREVHDPPVQRNDPVKKIRCLVLIATAGAILLAGCAQPQAPPASPSPATTAPVLVTPSPVMTAPVPVTPVQTSVGDTVRIVSDPTYGQILADADGKTLYYFTKDTPGAGKSVCTAGCPGAWPPFRAAAIRVSSPLKASDFGEISRPDGSRQTTYLGWPLYRYFQDTAPGDTNGYGVNGFWFVMSPSGVVTPARTTAAPTQA